MKRVVLAGALAVISMMGAAHAADMQRPQAMPTKAAPMYMAPVYNWTGMYAGINAGYGWGSSNRTNAFGSTGSFDVDGGVVGGTLGYNWQAGQTVFGLEGDVAWSGIKGSSSAGICAVGSCETRNNWLGTVRGRIGYAFDRVMPFVTGGLAVGDIKATSALGLNESETKAGWTLGGGAEFALTGPWTAKAEYLYVDLGTNTLAGADTKFHTNIVRGGLNYRF
ncbi:MAG: porin family protein [Pseudolabrys sp.]|nr:porin family protein [Pseudolabrys sp.]